MIHHNSLRVSDSTLLVTEEDLRPGCRGSGSFETWKIRAGAPARRLDRFEVERDGRAGILCSSHYFDHRDGLVAVGFFQQGLRLLNVQDPRRITQVGYYISDTAMVWGALYAPTDPAGEVVYVLDHAKGIDVIELDRAALTPVRRPDRPRRSGGGLDVFGVVSDGVEVARPGQRLRIRFAAGVQGGPARNVRLELQLPAYVRPLRLPRGAHFERRSHRVLLRLPRLRSAAVRAVPARVSRRAPRGAPLELIFYARAPRDRMPLSDRWVDRGRIGRRERGSRGALATAAAGRRFGVCVLGPRL